MPSRKQQEAKPNRPLAEVIAANVRGHRSLRRLTQDDLAARMRELGQETWSRATVSELERGGRRISVDELPAMAIALDLDVPTLLHPSGVDRREKSPVVIGGTWDAKPAELYGLLTGRGQAIRGRWDGNRLLMMSVTVIEEEEQ